jgi:glycerol-3-phosphate dehydrogenase
MTPLPGGDFAYDGVTAVVERMQPQWPFLARDETERLVRAYGTRAANVLQGATRPDDLGVCFGAGLTAVEVRYLMAKEWAKTADDVLWRRSKLGLSFSPAQQAALERFMAAAPGG